MYVRMRSLQIYYGNDIIITKDKNDIEEDSNGKNYFM